VQLVHRHLCAHSEVRKSVAKRDCNRIQCRACITARLLLVTSTSEDWTLQTLVDPVPGSSHA
jgi:hypothetical protein